MKECLSLTLLHRLHEHHYHAGSISRIFLDAIALIYVLLEAASKV
jgi:hypothetical protein